MFWESRISEDIVPYCLLNLNFWRFRKNWQKLTRCIYIFLLTLNDAGRLTSSVMRSVKCERADCFVSEGIFGKVPIFNIEMSLICMIRRRAVHFWLDCIWVFLVSQRLFLNSKRCFMLSTPAPLFKNSSIVFKSPHNAAKCNPVRPFNGVRLRFESVDVLRRSSEVSREIVRL